MQEPPTLSVAVDDDDTVTFNCQFERLSDVGVQYQVEYIGDGQQLDSHTVRGLDAVPSLADSQMEDLEYGSRVNVLARADWAGIMNIYF